MGNPPLCACGVHDDDDDDGDGVGAACHHTLSSSHTGTQHRSIITIIIITTIAGTLEAWTTQDMALPFSCVKTQCHERHTPDSFKFVYWFSVSRESDTQYSCYTVSHVTVACCGSGCNCHCFTVIMMASTLQVLHCMECM